MTQRTTCSACGGDELHTFLDLGTSPIADAYTSTPDEVSKLYPLELAVCATCKLVQLLEVVDGDTLFGTGYSFYSSASQPLSDYHHAYADAIWQQHPKLARRFVVEIGCNDGDLLRWFAGMKTVHLGIDPADGPVERARNRGLNVLRQEFTSDIAAEVREDYGPAAVIVANHVLAHVADVDDFLRGVSLLLADDGVAYVEVQYLPDMLVNNAFDLIYHEHRNFFSLTSLESAALRHGLYVNDVRLTRRQGGSLRVELVRAAAGMPLLSTSSIDNVRESERWLGTGFGAYDGMQGRVERIRTRLLDVLWDVSAQHHPGVVTNIAGYGAPAKATTLLNFCGINRDVLDYVVDTTDAKQGRYIPGTGIPIIAPGPRRTLPDVYLLLSWNYAREIIARHRTYSNLRWIVPIPAPLIV